MIKPNELFIGAVLKDKNGRICRVEQVRKESLKEITFSAPAVRGALTSLPHSPIPITPEILTDWCGWYDIDYSESIKIIQNDDFIFKEMSKLGFSYITFRGKKLEHIKYLHQLQSLYQLLTGEEMPIKLPEE